MNIDFDKNQGLIPAIVQDDNTGKVLMMGYMNREAYNITEKTRKVTFYSRSKGRLWTKGEESGNYLSLVSVSSDCDGDTLLVKAIPAGPVCHTGADTCWGETNSGNPLDFLIKLGGIIESRKLEADKDSSYTARLFSEGIKKIAQKVGEEATELILEAMDNRDDLFIAEAADLLYHLMVLLSARGKGLGDVAGELKNRH